MAAMLYRTATILDVPTPSPKVDVVATYRSEDTLLSGWAIGTKHVAGKAGVVDIDTDSVLEALLFGALISAGEHGDPLLLPLLTHCLSVCLASQSFGRSPQSRSGCFGSPAAPPCAGVSTLLALASSIELCVSWLCATERRADRGRRARARQPEQRCQSTATNAVGCARRWASSCIGPPD